jgi:hypothetical protein
MKQQVSAEVITCPGRLGDFVYQALQVSIEGFNSPFVLTLALPAVGCRALAEQSDPAQLYKLIAYAINKAKLSIDVDVSTLKNAA